VLRVIVILAVLMVGCPVPGIPDRGPTVLSPQRNAVALETMSPGSAHGLSAPFLTVRPALDVTRRYTLATVSRHQSVQGMGQWELVLTVAGLPQVTVTYAPPGGYRMPVKVGQQVSIRFYPAGMAPAGAGFADAPVEDHSRRELFLVAKRRRNEPDLRVGGLAGWTLVLRDRRGGLVAAVFSGFELPLERGLQKSRELDQLRAGVSVAPLDEQVVYEEVRRLDNGCRAVIAHHTARAVETWPAGGPLTSSRRDRTGATFDAAPGTWRHITVQGRRYRWVLLDASANRGEACPNAPDSGHFSFALLLDNPKAAR